MSNLLEFESFPKIDRYTNETATITEKIDGTNACISIADDGTVTIQSRNKIIDFGSDNAGFAAWVRQNEAELVELLGTGRHFGEWWGVGIQRRYGLESRRFSLFNTHRWGNDFEKNREGLCREIGVANRLPVIVTHVPVLATCPLADLSSYLWSCHQRLGANGSVAAPGFMNPEGCMIYLHRLGRYLKAPLDATPKWAAEKAAA